MDKVLYDLMDWAAIEELVYSEAAEPQNLLGPHMTEAGLLIQAFIPTAVEVTVKLVSGDKLYPMEMQDEAGFFAVLLPQKRLADYTLLVTYGDGSQQRPGTPMPLARSTARRSLRNSMPASITTSIRKWGPTPWKSKA